MNKGSRDPARRPQRFCGQPGAPARPGSTTWSAPASASLSARLRPPLWSLRSRHHR